MSEAEVLELLYLVLKRFQFINGNQTSEQNWGKAKDLTEDIDVKDVSFVALAIEMGAKLWTGDKKLYKGLRKKGFMDVVSLEDLKEILKNKIKPWQCTTLCVSPMPPKRRPAAMQTDVANSPDRAIKNSLKKT